MLKPAPLFILLAVALNGCSTWDYSLRARPAEGRVEPGVVVRATEGEVEISNHGPTRAFLVWDRLSAIIPGGVQRRAYKGSQTRINAEASIPPQPIEPGATLRETYVVREFPRTEVSLPRPVTALDLLFGWLYGAGCLVADLTWTPDDEYKRRVFGGLGREGELLYELVVPIALEGDGEQTPRLQMISAGVAAKKR